MAEPSSGAGTGASPTGPAGNGQGGSVSASGAGGQFLPPREVLIVLPGLLMAILLAMLDNLIVSTALPRIVGDLGGVAHLSWVVTAYILASTITTPFYGKLGDMYGRKKFFIAAIIIFLAGSALSGLSQSMAELIAFRAIQGLGAGGLMVGAMATLGDIVAPRERGRYMSYMMVVMMLATIGGPLLGGFITTSFSWRWIFYINIPLGGAALVYLLATLHVPAKKVSHKVDYLGGSLLAVAATALILLATWGGTQYAWGSPQIIGLALLTVAAGVAFYVTEMRAAEPMMPLHVYRNRNFSLSMAMTFLTGLAMFGAMTFLPLFQQTVQGESPTVSGLALTPMMLGVTVTSIVAGQVTTKTGRYKVFPILGGAIMAVGMFLLAGLGVGTSRLDLGAVLRGARPRHGLPHADGLADRAEQRRAEGHGRGQQRPDVLPADRRVARRGRVRRPLRPSADDLARRRDFKGRPGVHISASGGQLNPATVNSLPALVRHDVFAAIADAIQHVFIWALPAAVVIFVLAWFIKEVPLRGRAPAAEATSEQPELVG